MFSAISTRGPRAARASETSGLVLRSLHSTRLLLICTENLAGWLRCPADKMTGSCYTTMIKKIEGKMMSGKDTGIWPLFFILKEKFCRVLSTPTGLWMQHFIKVCVWAWILHPYSRAASIQRRQISWKQARTVWGARVGGISNINFWNSLICNIFARNFVFVPILSRSRSLFRTDAHLFVKAGLRCQH